MTPTNPRASIAFRIALSLMLLATIAAPVAAGATSGSPLIGSYWTGFVDHWLGQLKQQNGVVLFALGIGAVSLFIITRGKWKK